MRVAFLTPSLGLGGAERWIVTLAREFKRRGHVDPVACFLTHPNFERSMIAEARSLMPVRFLGEPIQADALIAWGCSDLAEITDGVDVPVIDVSHSSSEWGEYATMLRKSCVGASHLAAVSRAAAAAFPGIVRDKVTVLPNGVDPARVGPIRGRAWMRDQLRMADHEKAAVFLGRLADEKGPERFLAAVPELPEDWIGVFVGTGPMESSLKAEAARRATGRVVFCSPVSEIGDILAAADCLVMPSRYEGHPLSLNEAWLAGVPAVTTDFDFIRHVNDTHGDMAITVPMDHRPAQLAAAILRADMQRQYDTGPTVRAKRVAEEHYTADAMAGRWESFLEEIVR